MRIKRERESSPEEEAEKRYPTRRIKEEPLTDSEQENQESQPTRKKFRRIKEIRDSDSSEEEEDEEQKRQEEEEDHDEESESGIDSNQDDENEKSESSSTSPPPSPISKHLRSKDTKKKATKKSHVNLKRKAKQRQPSPSSSSSSSEDQEVEESDSSGSSSTKGNIEFEDSSEDEGSDKSCSSTSESELDEDESLKCCLVCRNLGNTNVKGRSRISSTPWCKCGHCKIIGNMRDYDRVCCRELKDVVVFLDDEMEDASKKQMCITEHPRFKVDVLKQQALQRTGYSRTSFYGNDDNYQSAWAFIRWVWNRLGYGTRMIIPSCVAAKIKESNRSGSYFKSFSAVTTCQTAKHCASSQHQ